MQETLNLRKKIKIHFLVKKKVNYGYALYVTGSVDALGSWDIPRAFRLNWNPDDYWSGFLYLAIRGQLKIQFKYIITHYDFPNVHEMQWEEGEFNRQITITTDDDNVLICKTSYILESVWNANQICLNLLVPKNIISTETEIYLAGGCNELGNWKSRLKLNQIKMEDLSVPQFLKAEQNVSIQDYCVYSVTVLVERNLRCFNYYFIKKTGTQLVPDRVPQREFKVHLCENENYTCLYTSDRAGNYELLEMSQFVSLHFSKITNNIYIGGCIETIDDVKELKKKGVTAIIYLTPCQLSHAKYISTNLTKMVSQENKIIYNSIKINLGHPETLVEQARVALSVVALLLQAEESMIYLFCNKGTLLAPLLVALYLSIYEGMNLKKALEFVKEKYPPSAIDENIIEMANDVANQNYFQPQRPKLNNNKSCNSFNNDKF